MIEKYLSQYSENGGVTVLRHDTLADELTFLKLFILIYADDTVLLAESAQGLPNALDSLFSYCKIWRLEVNTDKTKVIVISYHKFKENKVFSCNNQVIGKVHHFQYLGVIFNSKGNFFQAKKHLYTQASKAMHSLLKNIRSNDLPVNLSLQRFDSLVIPILLYCCEVWDQEDFKILEELHLRFCKLILEAPEATPSYTVHGELGRQPRSFFVNARITKFWRKIITLKNSKFYRILYNSIVPKIDESNPNNRNCRFK